MEKNHKTSWEVILAIVLTTLVVGGGAGAGMYLLKQTEIDDLETEKREVISEKNQLKNRVDELDKKVSEVLKGDEKKVDETDKQKDEVKIENAGIIEGSLSYPSEVMPQDMAVCAENKVTKEKYCSNKHITDDKYQYGEGYKIEVPEGIYTVYAYLPETSKYGAKEHKGDYKAYYSEFVTCGAKAGCPSHQPIEVSVKNGETKDSVDPGDWYSN